MDLAKKLNYLDILKEQNDMGLKECRTDGEKGHLIDTCLSAQDKYKKRIKEYLKGWLKKS